MTGEANLLKSIVDRPSNLISAMAVITVVGAAALGYSNVIERLDSAETRLRWIDTQLADARSRVELATKGSADLTSIVNLMGSRLDAQASRISGIDGEFAGLQRDIQQALRDQVSTDRSILAEMGKLETSFAELRSDMNWLSRVPIPPGTLAPREMQPGSLSPGQR